MGRLETRVPARVAVPVDLAQMPVTWQDVSAAGHGFRCLAELVRASRTSGSLSPSTQARREHDGRDVDRARSKLARRVGRVREAVLLAGDGPGGHPLNLDELNSASPADPQVVDLVLPEIGGGRLSPSELAKVELHPDATALRVSGLEQPTFELLVARYGAQFSSISFWKCPRVEDLSPLEDLPQLTHVAYYWNQRATKLWNLAKTPDLKSLQFQDFTRLGRLDDVAAGRSLEELEFGDLIWMKNSVESLDPLASLHGLRRLGFALKKVGDGRVQPVGRLKGLEYFECPSNMFTTEQLAWLRARLPHAEGRVLRPFARVDPPLPGDEGIPPKDVLVMGKRKPFLNSSADTKRIDRYVKEFEDLVERFRSDPALEPKPT